MVSNPWPERSALGNPRALDSSNVFVLSSCFELRMLLSKVLATPSPGCGKQWTTPDDVRSGSELHCMASAPEGLFEVRDMQT